jgi:uncharacterized protein (UPF0335 family)
MTVTKLEVHARVPAEPITAPTLLKAYVEALERNQRWQASIDQLIREMLELKADHSFDPATVPSADEIRNEMNRYIPEGESLSDLIIAMREE